MAGYSTVQSPSENWTVRNSNGHFLDTICVQFSNGIIGHLVFNHTKTGPVFRPQYIGKANWPFENWTRLSGIQIPFEYRTIWLENTNQPSEYPTSPVFGWWLYFVKKYLWNPTRFKIHLNAEIIIRIAKYYQRISNYIKGTRKIGIIFL
jgi:hypothetical protein